MSLIPFFAVPIRLTSGTTPRRTPLLPATCSALPPSQTPSSLPLPVPLPLPPPSTKGTKPPPKYKIRNLYTRAKEAHSSGNIPKARDLLHKALTLDPQDSHSWLFLARLESRLRTPQSSQIFSTALDHCPNNVHLLHAWAVHEHRHGDCHKARDLFRTAYHIQPDNVYVTQAWGLLEQQCGNHDRARQLFKNAETNPELCNAWASLEARDGDVAFARQLFQRGLSVSKAPHSFSRLYCAWAELEASVGDVPKARQLLNDGIAKAPSEPGVYVALGRLEARRGGTVRAIELMRTAASLSKRPNASIFNHWALIEWLHCGRAEEAKRLLIQGSKIHPRDPSLLQTLATLEDKLGNSESAKEWFKASVKARPTAPALVAWALLEERQGDWKAAIDLFERALDADKLHGVAYNAYGMMYARRGELDAARAIYERGLQANASSSVWHGYGMLELKIARNSQRARKIFRQGTMRTSEDTLFIWHSWGMLELSEKSVLAARQVFDSALKRYPRNSRLLVGAAMAAAASSPATRADEKVCREFFRRAISADPTHAHAWQAWGVFELRQGKVDAALALFKRGLRLCPGHGALWQAWGVLETSRRNFTRARQLFERGAQSCPGHVHLFQAWACMEVLNGNIEKARQLLDKALESDSSHGPVWNAYGLLEARHGTLGQARQNFTTGIRRAPYHAPLYRTFGQMEVRAGNYDRARQLFEEGLRVDPRHAPLYHALAQFEGMMGNVTALAELKKKAEKYFANEEEAFRAMHGGDGSVSVTADDDDDDCNNQYEGKTTPMEIALEKQDSKVH